MPQGEEHNKQAKKPLPKRWIVVAVLGLLIALLAFRVARFVTAKPTIAINYAAQYNELTRPANYDPNDNAAPLYAQAFEILSEMPGDREALDMVAQAAEKPYWWFEQTCLDWTKIDAQAEIFAQMVGFRQTGRDLHDQALWLAANGDIDQALQAVTIVGKMARHVGGQGAMHGQALVATAMKGLAQSTAFSLLARHTIAADALESFQQDVEALLATPAPLSLASERLRLLDIVQRYFTDDGRGDGHLIVGKIYDEYTRMEELPNELADAVAYVDHLVIAWRHPSRKETVQLLENLIPWLDDLAQQTPWQLHQRGANYEDDIRKRITGHYFLKLAQLPGSLGRTIEIHQRLRVSGDALITTIALLRYRQDKGRWPENLEALANDGYIRNIPIDPFSGRTLTYEPTGETFLLYSFGADFDDDGGTPSNWGQRANGGDQVFWPR